mmetsp:Transcript_15334/g.20485  ORF Transcript_15334/g.20485 Transcript_15334/m.20485 type:complete len:213 (+) Transcript_15334:3617-4255(+)
MADGKSCGDCTKMPVDLPQILAVIQLDRQVLVPTSLPVTQPVQRRKGIPPPTRVKFAWSWTCCSDFVGEFILGVCARTVKLTMGSDGKSQLIFNPRSKIVLGRCHGINGFTCCAKGCLFQETSSFGLLGNVIGMTLQNVFETRLQRWQRYVTLHCTPLRAIYYQTAAGLGKLSRATLPVPSGVGTRGRDTFPSSGGVLACEETEAIGGRHSW